MACTNSINTVYGKKQQAYQVKPFVHINGLNVPGSIGPGSNNLVTRAFFIDGAVNIGAVLNKFFKETDAKPPVKLGIAAKLKITQNTWRQNKYSQADSYGYIQQ